MNVFFTRDVEIDRCMFCGGLWFDRDELQAALGHALELEPLEGSTRRRCAGCSGPMQPVLAGSIEAEHCGGCGSLYLDDGELGELGGETQFRPAPPSSAARDASEVTFLCRGCGERFSMGESAATSRGLSCGRCYGMMDDAGAALPTPMPRPAVIVHSGRLRTLFGDVYFDAQPYGSIADLADAVFDGFFRKR